MHAVRSVTCRLLSSAPTVKAMTRAAIIVSANRPSGIGTGNAQRLRINAQLIEADAVQKAGLGEKVAFSTSTKDGGDQIEYADQDPRIHAIWLDEMAKRGIETKMERWFPR